MRVHMHIAGRLVDDRKLPLNGLTLFTDWEDAIYHDHLSAIREALRMALARPTKYTMIGQELLQFDIYSPSYSWTDIGQRHHRDLEADLLKLLDNFVRLNSGGFPGIHLANADDCIFTDGVPALAGAAGRDWVDKGSAASDELNDSGPLEDGDSEKDDDDKGYDDYGPPNLFDRLVSIA
ncbi:hypothetical protein Micbo1qcDRAFT_180335 [Microdochium bolleyi]|uniref:Uncharacterized protein n=1 Tax=Microdochium bolleyi TaxID=196109 RepID=A0A136IMC0_9PEZI|nr:hypothetical protein Micbo1qcDRAFT_180335 [Microdochium bolleyi]